MDKDIKAELIGSYRNFVFIGEAGSGKTEFGVNLAMTLAEDYPGQVHFFDLDQTKPLFRARDVGKIMEDHGITVHSQAQFQDIPTMVPGIIESLNDPDEYTLLDIGGNVHGALMAGQLAESVNTGMTSVFFIINVYRPWSDSLNNIEKTKKAVMTACRVTNARLISNPTLGPTTTAEEIISGDAELREILGDDTDIGFICIAEDLCDKIEIPGKRIIPIHPYIKMPHRG